MRVRLRAQMQSRSECVCARLNVFPHMYAQTHSKVYNLCYYNLVLVLTHMLVLQMKSTNHNTREVYRKSKLSGTSDCNSQSLY